MFTFYPLLLALAGIAVSVFLSERALALLPPEVKGTLIDAFAPVRWLNLLGAGRFTDLVIWQQDVAWLFLGSAFAILGVWSALRAHRLHLPEGASRRLVAAMVARALGIVACALVYAVR